MRSKHKEGEEMKAQKGRKEGWMKERKRDDGVNSFQGLKLTAK